jgi:hypothetical protein
LFAFFNNLFHAIFSKHKDKLKQINMTTCQIKN